jgi:hypothetical protein
MKTIINHRGLFIYLDIEYLGSYKDMTILQ